MLQKRSPLVECRRLAGDIKSTSAKAGNFQCMSVTTLVVKYSSAAASPRKLLSYTNEINFLSRIFHSGRAMASKEKHVIDLRSDTLTVPTNAMREAIFKAEVGDDVYEEDPTVKALEQKAALLLGKEAGLFVPTATMGNLLAIMSHCNHRGTELITGDKTHIFKYEQGGAAYIAGVQVATIQNKEDGTFDLDEMEKKIRVKDIHEPVTALICIENTHNICGGKVLPMKWLDELWQRAAQRGIPVHLDGARLLNASTQMCVPPAALAAGCRSVTLCLSKGLGAPVGALLLADADFIARARYTRKALGGGMRQVGILAAAGLVALEAAADRLAQDHACATIIANGISSLGSKHFYIDPISVHTNIIMMQVDGIKITPEKLCNRLETVTDEEAEQLGKDAVIVKALDLENGCVRLITYNAITETDAELVVKKLQYINQGLETN